MALGAQRHRRTAPKARRRHRGARRQPGPPAKEAGARLPQRLLHLRQNEGEGAQDPHSEAERQEQQQYT